MRKGWSLFLVLLICALAVPGAAHERQEHNRILETVLFGREHYISVLSEQEKAALTALEYASYLSIDQANGHGTHELEYLKNVYRVPGLPKTVNAFNFKGNQYHRMYTHRGWEYVYLKDEGHWQIRKNLLLSTTEKIFHFDFLSGKILGVDMGYGKMCNSFSALVYYVHIIGDHEACRDWRELAYMIPLARAHASRTNPDIFSELEAHLSVLFEKQKNTHKYAAMMSELNVLAQEARKLAGTAGGVNTKEKLDIYHDQTERLLNILQIYVPNLLRNEMFFQNVFS